MHLGIGPLEARPLWLLVSVGIGGLNGVSKPGCASSALICRTVRVPTNELAISREPSAAQLDERRAPCDRTLLQRHGTTEAGMGAPSRDYSERSNIRVWLQ